MKPSEWDSILSVYADVKDVRRTLVFPALLERITGINPKTLLDFGGGDGLFGRACAETLPLEHLVSYDPSEVGQAMARKALAGWKFASSIINTNDLDDASFDVVTFNAVWMCLADWQACVNALREIRRLLVRDGRFFASVTHPCFRSARHLTYETDFDMRRYLNDGTQFRVRIFDGERDVEVVDTHWSLGAMSRQLNEVGFNIVEMIELSDPSPEVATPSWLIFDCVKD